MSLVKSNKTVDKVKINKDETFKVTLSLEGGPSIKTNPKDIVLILDRSGSMNGAPLMAMKKGATHFVDVIETSTNLVANGKLGNGTKIGVVGFDTKADIEIELSDDVAGIQNAINSLISKGTTNHEDAFIKAKEILDKSVSGNDQVVIMFTDGNSNSKLEGFDIADGLKAAGATIYSIGYGNASTIKIDTLNRWASAPVSDHVLLSPAIEDIEKMFTSLAETISEPAARDAVLIDTISPCFDVVSMDSPSKGTSEIVDDKTVKWKVGNVGGQQYEKVEFSFTVRNNNTCTGVQDVDESFKYSDLDNNRIDLPNPTVEIVGTTGGGVVVSEDCPVAIDATIPSCVDYYEYDAGDVTISGLGRVLQVTATIKSVCPNKALALATILHEVDSSGNEIMRGMKTTYVPAHSEATCQDVKVKCIKFVLPEELDVNGSATSLCNERKFKVRFIANYIDGDYFCCN